MLASTAESGWQAGVNKSHAGERAPLINPKVLLPVLITLHLAAVALIVEGLDVDERQSDDDSRARQVVEWNPACVAGHANEAIARYWSSEYRQPNAIVAEQQSCVNIR